MINFTDAAKCQSDSFGGFGDIRRRLSVVLEIRPAKVPAVRSCDARRRGRLVARQLFAPIIAGAFGWPDALGQSMPDHRLLCGMTSVRAGKSALSWPRSRTIGRLTHEQISKTVPHR
jgi:hypothetical protein